MTDSTFSSTLNLIDLKPIFTKKNNGNYIMEVKDRFFDVDDEVKTVVEILSSSQNYSQATSYYNIHTHEAYSEEDFREYSSELIKKFNLEDKKKSFLLFERIIIPSKIAGKTGSVLSFLFQPTFFWISIISLITFSLYQIFFADNLRNDNFSVPVIYTSLLYFITIIFHELGHISACRRFTGKNGGIGFGIYLIYPVLYSNISSLWHANKQEKAIANLAGVYMQLWFVLIFFILGRYFSISFFTDLSKIIIYLCFVQLLPFIRSDGYWLLSDLSGVSNLLEKSTLRLNEFSKAPFKTLRERNAQNFFLISYGAFNLFFVVSFAYYQLIYNSSTLIHLPKYIWETLQQIFTGSLNHITFDAQYIPAILFYYISYSYLKLFFKKLLTLIKNQNKQS